MSKKAVSMNRVYDIFAEETRKQARLYGLDAPRKLATKGERKPDTAFPVEHRRAAKVAAQA